MPQLTHLSKGVKFVKNRFFGQAQHSLSIEWHEESPPASTPVELVVRFGVLYREVGYALESAVSSHQLRIVVSSNACDENIWGAERLATIN